ncbi:MAG TPA: pilus assembly protein PilM [Polyangiaceae bacterium]|nr:pilus assembly protein PilM [Polyangiaceae bacterium]
MSRLIGIDIRATHVRAVLLQASYKRLGILRMAEVDLGSVETLEQALQACVLPLLQNGDMVATAIEGDAAFIHRLKLPATAQKQLAEVLPFELEAQVPVDLEELVYDYHVLKRTGLSEPVVAFVAAARIEYVRARIALIAAALGQEPERVGCGPLPLGNLASLVPTLDGPGPIALVDLGGARTEVLLLAGGEQVFARTLSRGVGGLPDTAPALAAELRQTFASWASHGGDVVQAAYLLGGGAEAPGAIDYLSYEVGIPIAPLPALAVDAMAAEDAARLPRFAKAISLAIGLIGRPRDLDLRRGPLAFQRGYGFLKDKAPILVGLVAAVFISFLFSTWAELRSLSEQNEILGRALGVLSREALGSQTTKGAEAREALAKALAQDGADPMPQMDAFGVIVAISNAIPISMTHDIEEFDMQRAHVKINGVVGSTADAQAISSELAKESCFDNVKISKITQVVNSDRQKYVLELDVKCPGDASSTKKTKKKTETSAEPATEMP